jgi:hypothetical protein
MDHRIITTIMNNRTTIMNTTSIITSCGGR